MPSFTSKPRASRRGTAALSRPTKPVDRRLIERSEDVLWSLSPTGLVLHQIVQKRFIELDTNGYVLWSYLDGARAVDEVLDRCASDARARARLRATIETLLLHQFAIVTGTAK